MECTACMNSNSKLQFYRKNSVIPNLIEVSMGDKTIPVWKNFRDNTWKSVTVQNLFLPKATCFEGSKCLSALAASSLAISLTLGDNQATRYMTSKASRATIRPFVKPPCPIPLNGKKYISVIQTPRGGTQPKAVEFSSVPSLPAFAHILYILFAYISKTASWCVPIV